MSVENYDKEECVGRVVLYRERLIQLKSAKVKKYGTLGIKSCGTFVAVALVAALLYSKSYWGRGL